MTNEYLRLVGSRTCYIPLLLSLAVAVGYLVGVDRASPVAVRPKIAANEVPEGYVDARLPLEKPELALDGDVLEETEQVESNGDHSIPDGDTDAQNSSRQQSGQSKESQAKQNSIEPTSNRRGQGLEFEIVVSHYKEPLDWIRPYATRAGHVYHKGLERGPPFELYKWEKLPNVGREAHTFLHHIIENYDNLADVTAFMPRYGSDPNNTSCFGDPQKFFVNAKKNISCKQQGNYSDWGFIQHAKRPLKALNKGKMRRTRKTMGEFYSTLFGTPPPPSVPSCLSGCFAATRENLRRRPLSFYRKAISFVNSHSYPEEVHYFARLWLVIIYG